MASPSRAMVLLASGRAGSVPATLCDETDAGYLVDSVKSRNMWTFFTVLAHTRLYAHTPNLSPAHGRLYRIGAHRLGTIGQDSGQRRSRTLPARLKRHRARGDPHDGEPVVRPLPGLAAGG